MKRRIFLVGSISVGVATAAAADEQPICATRPSKATAPCTAPAGHFQIETGLADWSLQKNGDERNTLLVVGATVVKYGLTDRSDIELTVTPWERSTNRVGGVHTSASGFGDLVVSYKQELTKSDAALQFSLMPFAKAPTAKRSLGNGKWEGGLLVPINYSFPKSPFSLNLTPEVDWAANADGHGHHAGMTQVASLGWQVNDKLNLSADIWGHWDWDPAGTTRQYSADGSVAYLVNKDVQLDAGANFGLNRNTPNVELYTGVSVRF